MTSKITITLTSDDATALIIALQDSAAINAEEMVTLEAEGDAEAYEDHYAQQNRKQALIARIHAARFAANKEG